MATATKQLDNVQDQVIDVLRRVQEPVVDSVRSVVDNVEDRLPEVDLPYGDKIPTADELVEHPDLAPNLLDALRATLEP